MFVNKKHRYTAVRFYFLVLVESPFTCSVLQVAHHHSSNQLTLDFASQSGQQRQRRRRQTKGLGPVYTGMDKSLLGYAKTCTVPPCVYTRPAELDEFLNG